MKNILLAALLLCATATTAAAQTAHGKKPADESRTVPFDALPGAAQSFIRDFYAADRVQRIRRDPSAKLFAYKVRMTDGDEIMFSRDGEWTDLESAAGIPTKLVPQEVASYVTSKYPGRKITEIGLERNGICVKLSDRTELMFESAEHNIGRHLSKGRHPAKTAGDTQQTDETPSQYGKSRHRSDRQR